MAFDQQAEQQPNNIHTGYIGGFWLEPGVHLTLQIAALDLVRALETLSESIANTVAEKFVEVKGEDFITLLRFETEKDEHRAAARANLYKLIVAICCEESLNRFSYFELPREISDVIEKLPSTEKILLASAFLKQPGMKSTQVYADLKSICDFRNRFAHGHNPQMSPKTLRTNHGTMPSSNQISTLQHEVAFLKRITHGYRNLLRWLLDASSHPINKVDWYIRKADIITKMFSCFSTKESSSLPDEDGLEYSYYTLKFDRNLLNRYYEKL